MITGTSLKNAVISGANNIIKNKTLVDDMNIFPVPDGDTGTNMSMTISAAVNEIANSNNDIISEVAQTIASSLLRGARGNSGVILSLLFRGLAKGLAGMEKADGSNIARALGLGVEAAYGAVMKPTEGTMLTVARVAYEKAREAALLDNDVVYVWSEVCKGAKEALDTTPELLPVLKKAGVVDAGGKGICLIFDGMLSVFKDGIMIMNDEANANTNELSTSNDFFRSAAAEFDQDIRFTYCTEYIVGRSSTESDSQELRSYLETIGDCVVVVDDEEIIKVHVHTEQPGDALKKALEFGQLLTVKVENMKEQHRLAAEKNKNNKKQSLRPVEPVDDFGFVAVVAGEGLESLFNELGCSHVVSGGQTMNPSTDDILEAILATPAKIVYVLPNNKNIILSAEQTIKLVEDRRVIVIPTKTIPQGLTSMLSFNPELVPEESASVMIEAASHVKTGQVTFAARDSEYGGFKIKKDDMLALNDGKLTFIEKDPVKAIIKLTRSLVNRNTSFVTLIYGKDVTEQQAEEAYNIIRSKINSRIDITLVKGDQPVYYFIVSVE